MFVELTAAPGHDAFTAGAGGAGCGVRGALGDEV